MYVLARSEKLIRAIFDGEPLAVLIAVACLCIAIGYAIMAINRNRN